MSATGTVINGGAHVREIFYFISFALKNTKKTL